jgi:Cu(I)/Ag(I) efflux system protein CusF
VKKLITLSAICCATLTLSGVALADDMSGMKMNEGAMASPKAGNATMTDAIVKKVDPATGMVTIKHGELANVGMPPMTMAFKARDAAMVKSVKEGDKVKVRVENVDGTMTIVKLAKQ